tara:strand:- start:6892 stop:7830 length:939 start_codon:yes stop_codon:yes gene_type:complete
MKYPALGLIFFLTATFHFVVSVQAQNLPPSERSKTLVIGKISDDPKKHHPVLERMGSYLAQNLSSTGIVKSDVLIAKDLEQMIDYLANGKVDLLSETAFSGLRLKMRAGAEIILHEWKKGVPFYRTIFFSAKDSGINALSDLKGKKIAFEDSGSTSGFLIPIAMLTRGGFKVEHLRSPRNEPKRDSIGFTFSRGELNMVTWVARGLVSAGAFSSTDWKEVVRTPDRLKKSLKIIATSKPIVRSLVLVRKNMSSNLKSSLRSVMKNMSNQESGRKMLSDYYKVSKYTDIGSEASKSLAEVKSLMQYLPKSSNK